MTTGRWDGVQGWGTARVVPHLDGQTMCRTTVIAREGPKNGSRHDQAPLLDLRPKPGFGALMATALNLRESGFSNKFSDFYIPVKSTQVLLSRPLERTKGGVPSKNSSDLSSGRRPMSETNEFLEGTPISF